MHSGNHPSRPWWLTRPTVRSAWSASENGPLGADGSVIRIQVKSMLGSCTSGLALRKPRPPLIKILYNFAVAKILPFTEARTHLTELLDEIERVHEHVVITRNGRPSAVVMSQAQDETLIGAREILGDVQLMAGLAGHVDEEAVCG